MQRKVVTCDRCGKEFDPGIDRSSNFRYEYITAEKLDDVHEGKLHGNYFVSKDICEDCYEQFDHFIAKAPETVPDSVEEAFNSICEKLTGLDRAEVMRILNKGNEEEYEKLFEMALDIICLEGTPLESLRPMIVAMHEAVTEDWEKQLEIDQIESGVFSKENHNASDI